MKTVQQIADEIIAREGGYINDPDDPGGATKYGVTIGTMRTLGVDVDGDGRVTTSDLRKLTRVQARDIFVEHYFHRIAPGFTSQRVRHVCQLGRQCRADFAAAFDRYGAEDCGGWGDWATNHRGRAYCAIFGPASLGRRLRHCPAQLLLRSGRSPPDLTQIRAHTQGRQRRLDHPGRGLHFPTLSPDRF